MALNQLHTGIDIPEYATRVPWLITESQLGDYLPVGQLAASPAGWPMLRFTLLGVTDTFGFNFVSHPERRLIGVAFQHPAGDDIAAVFSSNAAVLRDRLGDPNHHDRPDFHYLMWRDRRVWVEYQAGVPELAGAEREHRLSVYYHAGTPQTWIPPGERSLAEVVRLLNMLPGVEVVRVHVSPTYKALDLAVLSLESLARLAHMTSWANVRFCIGINWYRRANGGLSKSDPSGVLYRIEIPTPHEPAPGDSATTLQIVGIYVADDLREQRILAEDETERLRLVFNNLEPGDDNT